MQPDLFHLHVYTYFIMSTYSIFGTCYIVGSINKWMNVDQSGIISNLKLCVIYRDMDQGGIEIQSAF